MKKVSIIIVILVAVGVVYSGALLITKYTSYQAGIERKLPIHGTYSSADEVEPAYLTIREIKFQKILTQVGVDRADNPA